MNYFTLVQTILWFFLFIAAILLIREERKFNVVRKAIVTEMQALRKGFRKIRKEIWQVECQIRVKSGLPPSPPLPPEDPKPVVIREGQLAPEEEHVEMAEDDRPCEGCPYDTQRCQASGCAAFPPPGDDHA